MFFYVVFISSYLFFYFAKTSTDLLFVCVVHVCVCVCVFVFTCFVCSVCEFLCLFGWVCGLVSVRASNPVLGITKENIELLEDELVSVQNNTELGQH